MYPPFTRTQWADHFSNGGTGVTKFEPEMRNQYAQAVTNFDNPKVWLRGNELHCSREINDLEDFWRIFDSLDPEKLKATQND